LQFVLDFQQQNALLKINIFHTLALNIVK
jgi:hypothetical protein